MITWWTWVKQESDGSWTVNKGWFVHNSDKTWARVFGRQTVGTYKTEREAEEHRERLMRLHQEKRERAGLRWQGAILGLVGGLLAGEVMYPCPAQPQSLLWVGIGVVLVLAALAVLLFLVVVVVALIHGRGTPPQPPAGTSPQRTLF